MPRTGEISSSPARNPHNRPLPHTVGVKPTLRPLPSTCSLHIGSGTLCGFHTYVGADDMWVSSHNLYTRTEYWWLACVIKTGSRDVWRESLNNNFVITRSPSLLVFTGVGACCANASSVSARSCQVTWRGQDFAPSSAGRALSKSSYSCSDCRCDGSSSWDTSARDDWTSSATTSRRSHSTCFARYREYTIASTDVELTSRLTMAGS